MLCSCVCGLGRKHSYRKNIHVHSCLYSNVLAVCLCECALSLTSIKTLRSMCVGMQILLLLSFVIYLILGALKRTVLYLSATRHT